MTSLTPIENRIEETVLRGIHASGLRITLVPKADYSKTYGLFATNFGSIDNRFPDPETGKILEVPDGVAHFLEHKMFEDQDGDVSDRFSALGASCNASTSFTITSYIFSATRKVEECVDLLLDFVQSPHFTAELVEKEQGIIAQEIRMYEDDPSWRIFFNLLEALYRSHPVRINIAGTEESISHIDPQVLFACHRAFYRPGNMALTLVGNLDPARMMELIDADLAGREYVDAGALVREPSDLGPICRTESREKMDVARPKLLIGYKDLEVGGTGREMARRDLLTGIMLDMLFGRSSENHEKLYTDGVIDESFAADYTSDVSFGFAAVGGDTDEPERLEERIRDSIRQFVAGSGSVEADFERIRNKLLGKFVGLFDAPESVAHSFAGGMFRDVTPFDILETLQQLEAGQIAERAGHLLDDSRCARSLVLPRNGEGEGSAG